MKSKGFLALLGLGLGAVALLGGAIGERRAGTTVTDVRPDAAPWAEIRLAQGAGSYADPRGSYDGPPPTKPKKKKVSKKRKPKRSWGDTPVVDVDTGETK